MRRVRCHSHGGPEVLAVEETGIPEPGPGQVLIRTEAIGANYVDVQLRRETDRCLGLLAPSGRAVVFGASAGELTSVPVRSLFGLKTVSGFSLLAWRAADPERARADIAELTGLFGTGALRAVAGATLPLAAVSQAHRLLEERSVLGRLLLVP